MQEINVQYVAELARIRLTEEEETRFGGQLSQILEYVDKLNQLDVEGIDPMTHAVPLVNVTRKDEVQPSLSNELALKNAPASLNGLFKVPKIVE
ncbi:MAG TPA: Asp-tRNA(Asn)/Glu-tRNA(Gln) amidotransferase subunit GatC [Verrucomicrobiales bacterium]|jgi:aspartyl-tRNA(Asn)/glutamyl-tRNA(Gln) amidotransferase subunit C|nr:Asp-tRNA(Asn)/Glu-tRNA(Gln) amidotransferase subunit GatC [Verrucomicrobiales bacterium]